MLRVAAVVAALLSPAAFLLGPTEEHYTRPTSPDPGKEFQHHLAGPNAWVAVPVRAVGDVGVWGWTVEPSALADARSSASVTLTLVEDREGSMSYGGGWTMSPHEAEVNAHATRVVCCPRALATPGGQGEGEFETWLRDGETLWVVYVGANVDHTVPFELAFATSGDGDLAFLPAREGSDVWFVDLLDDAYADGINARLLGATLVGSAGTASRAFDAEHNGFVSLAYLPATHDAMDVRATIDGVTYLGGRASPGGGLLYSLGGTSHEFALTNREPGPSLPWTRTEWSTATLLYADLDVRGSGFANYEWDM